jgi:phospho-N-acetylmuramoyl-pentapeptide-transferase
MSAILVLFLMTGLGVVGFLDDFIKISKQRSLGLRSVPKLIGQSVVALLFAVLVLQFPNHKFRTPASTQISFIRDTRFDFAFAGATLGVILFCIWAYLMIAATSNGVNLTDGLDGLATGASTLVFAAYVLIGTWQSNQSCQQLGDGETGAAALKCYEVRDPRDLAVVAACLMGACIGFLWWNASPAKIFMGDTGALALGFLLACVAVQGVLKTAATIALLGPLLVMAVPILDTSFVIAKRLKYKRSPFAPDQNHFYHRFMRIGYSQRRTAAYLHLWALLLAAYALLLRFEPPRPLGHWQLDNTLIALGVGMVVLAASVWMVYTLEILKSRHLQVLRRGKLADEPEREEAVERAITAGSRR